MSELKPCPPSLKWAMGIHTTTDDDNGPMEGVPRNLLSWKSGPYLIVYQGAPDGRYILTGGSDGVGRVFPRLELAQADAEKDALIVKIATLSAEVERLRGERDAAIMEVSRQAAARGRAEGVLEASEAAGVVEGWRARAEAAKGVAIDDTLPNLPEVNRLRRELKTATARAEARVKVLEDALRRIANQPQSHDERGITYSVGYALSRVQGIARAALSHTKEG